MVLAVASSSACAQSGRRAESPEACTQRVRAEMRREWFSGEKEAAAIVGAHVQCSPSSDWPADAIEAQGDGGVRVLLVWPDDEPLCFQLRERWGELDAEIERIVVAAEREDESPARVLRCLARQWTWGHDVGPSPAARALARDSLDGGYAVEAAWVLAFDGTPEDLPAVRASMHPILAGTDDYGAIEVEAVLAKMGDEEGLSRLQQRLEPAPARRDATPRGRAFRRTLDRAADREGERASLVMSTLYWASLTNRRELVPSVCRHLESNLRSYDSDRWWEDGEAHYYEDEFVTPIPETAVETLVKLVPADELPEPFDTVPAWQGWCRTHGAASEG